jgi:hypothetical protein
LVEKIVGKLVDDLVDKLAELQSAILRLPLSALK